MSTIAVPRFRLLPEVFQILFMVWMQHFFVRHRNAHRGELFEELLVPSLQEVDLREVQRRVITLISIAILLPQKSVPGNNKNELLPCPTPLVTKTNITVHLD